MEGERPVFQGDEHNLNEPVLFAHKTVIHCGDTDLLHGHHRHIALPGRSVPAPGEGFDLSRSPGDFIAGTVKRRTEHPPGIKLLFLYKAVPHAEQDQRDCSGDQIEQPEAPRSQECEQDGQDDRGQAANDGAEQGAPDVLPRFMVIGQQDAGSRERNAQAVQAQRVSPLLQQRGCVHPEETADSFRKQAYNQCEDNPHGNHILQPEIPCQLHPVFVVLSAVCADDGQN